MTKCPLTKGDCTADCAWWGYDGECYIASLPGLVEKLEDVAAGIESLGQTIKNIDFGV